MLPPQLNFFTLACRDVERMGEFFRALGWPESPASEPVHRVFNIWDVVWKHGSTVDEHGHLIFEP
jgi:hypothetical protein